VSGLVRITRQGGRLRVALNRPDRRNALSGELLDELRAALDDAARDVSVRVVVLCGEGRDFCAGADIGHMRELGDAGPDENRADAERLGAAFRAVHAFPRPVVARVHGNVFGGGNGLVAAADIAVCARDARFAFSEVRLGIVPAVISPYVVRRIGDAWTRRLFLTGERFDADRAAAIGLCTSVVDPDDLDGAVDHVVAALLLGSPDAQRRIKLLVEAVQPGRLEDADRVTPEHIAAARASEEGQEGLRAFLEKRKPFWVTEGGA
jgi:methylglutaconyl-CoA hydratase